MSQTTSTVSNFTPAAAASDVARIQFIISNMMSGMRTAIPVQVVSVTNNGGVSPIGYVDVQPAVSAKAGDGTVQPHGIIHNVPYMRIQGGTNAVIIDPQVGDIGIATVCDRDISTVKSSQAISAPGSSRKYDMSDMVYLMTIIGAQTPTQYVQFNSAGITITSPNKVVINANEVDVNATNLNINATNIASSGAWNHTGTIKNNSVNIGSTHTHPVHNITTGGATVESDVPQ